MIELTLDKLGVSYGQNPVLYDICAHVKGPQLISVIGHNGSGKRRF